MRTTCRGVSQRSRQRSGLRCNLQHLQRYVILSTQQYDKQLYNILYATIACRASIYTTTILFSHRFLDVVRVFAVFADENTALIVATIITVVFSNRSNRIRVLLSSMQQKDVSRKKFLPRRFTSDRSEFTTDRRRASNLCRGHHTHDDKRPFFAAAISDVFLPIVCEIRNVIIPMLLTNMILLQQLYSYTSQSDLVHLLAATTYFRDVIFQRLRSLFQEQKKSV